LRGLIKLRQLYSILGEIGRIFQRCCTSPVRHFVVCTEPIWIIRGRVLRVNLAPKVTHVGNHSQSGALYKQFVLLRMAHKQNLLLFQNIDVGKIWLISVDTRISATSLRRSDLLFCLIVTVCSVCAVLQYGWYFAAAQWFHACS
jgi:hypothetical protein